MDFKTFCKRMSTVDAYMPIETALKTHAALFEAPDPDTVDGIIVQTLENLPYSPYDHKINAIKDCRQALNDAGRRNEPGTTLKDLKDAVEAYNLKVYGATT
jgi:Mg2+/Co2+ transporter CorC